MATSIATPPACASDWVYDDSWASNCMAAYPCLCSDQSFLSAAESSIQQQCDAADQQSWARYFAQNCPGIIGTTGLIVSTVFTPSNPTTTAASSPNPKLSTLITSEISFTTSNSSPVVPTQSTGLSVGDKAGIAAAILTAVGIVITVLVVRYRRKLEA